MFTKRLTQDKPNHVRRYLSFGRSQKAKSVDHVDRNLMGDCQAMAVTMGNTVCTTESRTLRRTNSVPLSSVCAVDNRNSFNTDKVKVRRIHSIRNRARDFLRRKSKSLSKSDDTLNNSDDEQMFAQENEGESVDKECARGRHRSKSPFRWLRESIRISRSQELDQLFDDTCSSPKSQSMFFKLIRRRSKSCDTRIKSNRTSDSSIAHLHSHVGRPGRRPKSTSTDFRVANISEEELNFRQCSYHRFDNGSDIYNPADETFVTDEDDSLVHDDSHDSGDDNTDFRRLTRCLDRIINRATLRSTADVATAIVAAPALLSHKVQVWMHSRSKRTRSHKDRTSGIEDRYSADTLPTRRKLAVSATSGIHANPGNNIPIEETTNAHKEAWSAGNTRSEAADVAVEVSQVAATKRPLIGRRASFFRDRRQTTCSEVARVSQVRQVYQSGLGDTELSLSVSTAEHLNKLAESLSSAVMLRQSYTSERRNRDKRISSGYGSMWQSSAKTSETADNVPPLLALRKYASKDCSLNKKSQKRDDKLFSAVSNDNFATADITLVKRTAKVSDIAHTDLRKRVFSCDNVSLQSISENGSTSTLCNEDVSSRRKSVGPGGIPQNNELSFPIVRTENSRVDDHGAMSQNGGVQHSARWNTHTASSDFNNDRSSVHTAVIMDTQFSPPPTPPRRSTSLLPDSRQSDTTHDAKRLMYINNCGTEPRNIFVESQSSASNHDTAAAYATWPRKPNVDTESAITGKNVPVEGDDSQVLTLGRQFTTSTNVLGCISEHPEKAAPTNAVSFAASLTFAKSRRRRLSDGRNCTHEKFSNAPLANFECLGDPTVIFV